MKSACRIIYLGIYQEYLDKNPTWSTKEFYISFLYSGDYQCIRIPKISNSCITLYEIIVIRHILDKFHYDKCTSLKAQHNYIVILKHVEDLTSSYSYVKYSNVYI